MCSALWLSEHRILSESDEQPRGKWCSLSCGAHLQFPLEVKIEEVAFKNERGISFMHLFVNFWRKSILSINCVLFNWLNKLYLNYFILFFCVKLYGFNYNDSIQTIFFSCFLTVLQAIIMKKFFFRLKCYIAFIVLHKK